MTYLYEYQVACIPLLHSLVTQQTPVRQYQCHWFPSLLFATDLIVSAHSEQLNRVKPYIRPGPSNQLVAFDKFKGIRSSSSGFQFLIIHDK